MSKPMILKSVSVRLFSSFLPKPEDGPSRALKEGSWRGLLGPWCCPLRLARKEPPPNDWPPETPLRFW